jgi:hypothetical protein
MVFENCVVQGKNKDAFIEHLIKVGYISETDVAEYATEPKYIYFRVHTPSRPWEWEYLQYVARKFQAGVYTYEYGNWDKPKYWMSVQKKTF